MKSVIKQLEQARSRSRMLLVTKASCLLLVGIILWLTLVMALDSMLLLPGPFRLLLLILGLVLLALGIIRSLVPALKFNPGMTRIALRAERLMPELGEKLASAVEFSRTGTDKDNPLAASAIADVEGRVGDDGFKGLINTSPARKAGALGLVVIGLLLCFVLIYPSSASIGFQRTLLPLGMAKWPSTTALVPLMEDKTVHPRGVPLPLSTHLTLGDPDSTRVNAEYTLYRDGQVVRTRSIVLASQANEVFERLIETDGDSMEVTFRTFDFETDPIRIDLVEPPSILSAQLTVEPPPYAAESMEKMTLDLGRGTDPRGMPESPFIMGSRAEITFDLSKPIPHGDDEWVDSTFGDLATGATFKSLGPTRWQISLRLDRTTGGVVSLVDEHGISNIEEIAYGLQVIPDRPPSAAILDPKMDETVLANATIPIRAEVRDDISVGSSRIEISRAGPSGSAEVPEPVRTIDGGSGSEMVVIDHLLDLATIPAAPGDVFNIIAAGTDTFELDDQTHEEARSGVRRLMVINDTDFIDIMRSQLASVRRNAIRLESMQGEAQDRARAGGLRVSDEQGRISERIAVTNEAIEEMMDRVDRNQLDDPMLKEILRQSEDLLEAAGRASSEAGSALELMQESTSESPGRAQSGESGESGVRSGESGETRVRRIWRVW